jgi:hypothetical protein
MARGSAKEVAAILDVGHRFRVVRDDERERGRDLCDSPRGDALSFPLTTLKVHLISPFDGDER